MRASSFSQIRFELCIRVLIARATYGRVKPRRANTHNFAASRTKTLKGGKVCMLERRFHYTICPSDQTERWSMVDLVAYFFSWVQFAYVYVHPNKTKKNNKKKKKVPPMQGTQKWRPDSNSPQKIVQDIPCSLFRTRFLHRLKAPSKL